MTAYTERERPSNGNNELDEVESLYNITINAENPMSVHEPAK